MEISRSLQGASPTFAITFLFIPKRPIRPVLHIAQALDTGHRTLANHHSGHATRQIVDPCIVPVVGAWKPLVELYLEEGSGVCHDVAWETLHALGPDVGQLRPATTDFAKRCI